MESKKTIKMNASYSRMKAVFFIVIAACNQQNDQGQKSKEDFKQVPISVILSQDSQANKYSIALYQDTVSMAIKVRIGDQLYQIEPIYSAMKQTPVFKLKQQKNKWFLLVYAFDYFAGNYFDNLQIIELDKGVSSYRCGFVNMPNEINGKAYTFEEHLSNDTLWVTYNDVDSLSIRRSDFCVFE